MLILQLKSFNKKCSSAVMKSTSGKYTSLFRSSGIVYRLEPQITCLRYITSRAAKSIVNERKSNKPKKTSEDIAELENSYRELEEERARSSPNVSSQKQTDRKFELPRKSMMEHPMLKRIPVPLRRYAGYFLDAPLIYGTSFLILHEMTAIVPLFGLWGLFHQIDFTPQGMPEWLLENGNRYVERIATRYNWDITTTQQGSRLMLEGAASYAIVKALLPLRAALSLYLTPWFARLILGPLTKFASLFQKKKNISQENSEPNSKQTNNGDVDLALDDELKESVEQKKSKTE